MIIDADWLDVAALVALVSLAAFFAASEAALISISRLRALAMLERGIKQAQSVVSLIEDRNRFLTSVLIANTVVLLTADSLATALFIKLGLPEAAVLSTVLMAVVILLFGEIIPKTIAVSDAERWAVRLAPPMRAIAWLLTPLVRFMMWLVAAMLRPFGIKDAQHLFVTEEDIRTLVNVGAEQRVIEEQEREMIHSIIEFGDTIVREIMTPRPEVIAVAIDDTPRRALDVVVSEGYAKLPVYQESKDDIVGVVHDRDLLVALANASLAQTSVRAMMRPVAHVPETKKIAELLREMQRDKFSMAIVVDEYGGTAGLVTMEDLLEEIVGEIRDEHDDGEEEPIRQLNDGEALIEAGVNIEDVNAELGTHLPDDDFETIGGLTVGLLGHLPSEGEEVTAVDGTRLRVERTRGRRILGVRVLMRLAQTSDDEDDDRERVAG